MTRNLALALLATFIAFCTIYTLQPLLPQMGVEFGVSAAQSALLVTMTMLPLGLAPIVYGYFLQAIPARSMLRNALLLLSINQFIFVFATEFWHLLALRFAQGLLIPAILTSLVTYCATMAGEGRVRRVVSMYIATTILGGFASRVLGGVLAQWLSWQWMFASMALLILPVYFALRYIQADAEVNFQRLELRSIKRVLQTPLFRNGYLILFGGFFAFAGLLNVLPFRLNELAPNASSFAASMLYTGYLVGVPLALCSEQLARRSGGVRRALVLSLGVAMLGVGLYASSALWLIFANMFLAAGGMFFLHATLSGLLNAEAVEHKGVVNGLYVSVYYLSGALGSWLLAWIYSGFGWGAVVLGLLGLLCGCALLVTRLPTGSD